MKHPNQDLPYWRWTRNIAIQESRALRAYARAGISDPDVAPTDLFWSGFLAQRRTTDDQ